MRRVHLATILAAIFVAVLAACSSSPAQPTEAPEPQLASPTPTPTVRVTEIELRSSGSIDTLSVAEGSRVTVIVTISQDRDPSIRCGNPRVLDSFGNTLVHLVPFDGQVFVVVLNRPQVQAIYGYSFIAPSEGEYSVAFDNQECAVRGTAASATIEWTVNPYSFDEDED